MTNTDTLHEPGGHPEWHEERGFSFYDRASDVCGLMRIIFKPSRQLKEMGCWLFMPDGSLVWLKEDAATYDKTLKANKLEFHVAEPAKRWRLTFVGGMVRITGRKERKSHVEFDLDFTGLNDLFDYRGASGATTGGPADVSAIARVEQFGSVTGRLSTGLEEFDMKALGGYRRSWGVRDWRAMKTWTWMSCQFSEARAFGISRYTVDDEVGPSGFVFDDGRNSSVTDATLTVNSDISKNPRMFEVAMTDSEGRNHKVVAMVTRTVATHIDDLADGRDIALHAILAKYNLGGSVGYGVVEHLVTKP